MKMSFIITTTSDIEIIIYNIVDVIMFYEFKNSKIM